MLIDCHVHLNNYHSGQIVPTAEHCKELFAKMDERGVDHAVVLTSYRVSADRPGVEEVLSILEENPRVTVVEGLRWRGENRTDLFAMEERIRDGHVRGIKLYPGYEPFYPADPVLEPVYQLAEEFGVPVMIHSGDTFTPRGKLKFSHPLHIDEVAVDHPGVNFVICHIGNPWIRDCMEVVYKNANVYTDISGLVLGDFSDRFESYMQRQLQEMLLYGVEPDNVLYGTDWPISSMQSYLDFIEELKIPLKERRKIMYENAARLFRLPVVDDGPKLDSFFQRLV